MIDKDWRSRANCLDVEPNLMQPDAANEADVATAKAVCAGCPVKRECLQLAKDQDGGAYGVHAGEWFGPPPVARVGDTDPCEWCMEPVVQARTGGRRRQFCSGACRKRAQRARQEAERLSA